MNTIRVILFLISIVLVSSCVPTKRLTYLQRENSQQTEPVKLKRTLYKVQPNDILNITIRSYDAQTDALFNNSNINRQALQGGDLLFYLQGYSIGIDGLIHMPILGEIQVNGLTIDEIQAKVSLKLNEFFQTDAINVSVQLAGVRFSVIGEVNRPGKYTIFQNQVTIFEALASAGDITIVGDRKEVMIVRQTQEGVITKEIDLTDPDIIEEEFYFVQPNDVLNIKPLPQKSYGIGTTGFQTFSQVLSVLASTITLIIAINSLN